MHASEAGKFATNPACERLICLTNLFVPWHKNCWSLKEKIEEVPPKGRGRVEGVTHEETVTDRVHWPSWRTAPTLAVEAYVPAWSSERRFESSRG